MDTKVLYRGFGFLAFFIALATYMATVQPTVPFWDCGEFSAATALQQVPHPPGAPLFLMIGKIFHLLPFGDPGWRVNLVSVFSSAITVGLLYLITVKVIRNFHTSPIDTIGEAIAVYGSALVAALAYTYSDSFWFNAVESEVYALSTMFVALVVYLLMRWNEEADNPGHERYLLLIAYLIGLSTGVQLLSILPTFSIVLLVYFRKYRYSTKGLIFAGLAAIGIFIVIYPGIVKWFPQILNWAWIAGLIIVAGAIYGAWYGYKNSRPILNLACSAFLLAILGYSCYTHILIRSNANPPMNENAPNNLPKLISYLGREQYGDAPVWPRRFRWDDPYFQGIYQNYGPWYQPEMKVVEKDGRSIQEPDWGRSNVNNLGELNYLFDYQIHQMFTRYLFWNFVGRESDAQGAQTVWFAKTPKTDELNYNSGYAPLFPIRFFALPLIFGLIGILYQFRCDPKMAAVYFLMFLMMGVIAAVQQNQQNPQPRERDYFYIGAFMVYAMWIGLGAFALLDRLRKENRVGATAATGVVIASLALVPLNMAVGGWKMHSRAGNYLPFDYSYNILQSLEKDAILFTNGDNDTFPLWYLQDVAGVRRDVRVVNLSLGGTTWYVDQLKNQSPHGAKKIPLSFSDESLQVPEDDPMSVSRPNRGPAQNVSIPVSAEVMQKFGGSGAGIMTYPFSGRVSERDPNGQTIYYYLLPHKLVNDILVQTKFERPVYFSTTVGQPGTPGESDVFAGTDDFLRLEGMAYRVCPTPQKTQGGEAINSAVMEKCLVNTLPDNEVHTEPHYGFKLRNLNNPSVYYDEVHRRLMDNYRLLYLRYAQYLLQSEKNNAKAVAVLDKMNSTISLDQFPISYGLLYNIADFYRLAGAMPQAKLYARKAIESSKKLIDNPELMEADRYSRSFNPYYAAASAYGILNDSANVRSMLRRLANQNGADPTAEAKIDEMEINMHERNGNLKAALEAAEKIAAKYRSSNQELYRSMLPNIEAKIAQLKAQLGGGQDTLADSLQ